MKIGGENAGRMMRHAAVVRSFGVIGKVDPKGPNVGQMVSTLRLPKAWKRDRLKAAVFVQERESYRIVGANAVELR